MPKPTKKQQQWVNRTVALWKKRLLLHDWAIILEFPDEQKKQSGMLTRAEIIVNGRYKDARLIVHPSLFELPIGYRKATIVHELFHIITDDVWKALHTSSLSESKRTDMNEALTEHFARVLFIAYSKDKHNYQI